MDVKSVVAETIRKIVTDRFGRQFSVSSASMGGVVLLRKSRQAPGGAALLMYPPSRRAGAGPDNERTQPHNAPRALSSRLSFTNRFAQ